MMESPSKNVEKMQTMAEELNSSLDVAGHALPMALFASAQAQPAEIEMGAIIERKEPDPAPEPVAVPTSEAEVVEEQPEPEVESVPLPTESVPLPTDSVPLPDVDSVPLPTTEIPTEEVEFKNEVEVDSAAQDAFAGAFGSQLVPETQPEPTPEPTPEPAPEPIQEVVEATPEPVEEVSEPTVVSEPVVEQPVEEEWVSDAERFIAADVDESGSLSVEELAVAANVSMEEAEALHSAADTDGDGEVSLSEFVSSDAAQKMSSLPRPVAPVRKPIQQQQPRQPVQQQQPQSPGVAAPQMGWQQPQPQQQQMPQQPAMNIQPTIRSGIHCRGCGIGLDPHWRYCPVCGNMNMSAHR
ncbi:MAG: EF-hand domain-containing protein, partial [Candidatus Thermoplasmatota archaeon]|nr:EF-hand domain-containing protein [Candidatus Thermoplasmatota archaeon]